MGCSKSISNGPVSTTERGYTSQQNLFEWNVEKSQELSQTTAGICILSKVNLHVVFLTVARQATSSCSCSSPRSFNGLLVSRTAVGPLIRLLQQYVTIWLFLCIGGPFVSLCVCLHKRAVLLGVYIGAPDFGKLPYEAACSAEDLRMPRLLSRSCWFREKHWFTSEGTSRIRTPKQNQPVFTHGLKHRSSMIPSELVGSTVDHVNPHDSICSILSILP